MNIIMSSMVVSLATVSSFLIFLIGNYAKKTQPTNKSKGKSRKVEKKAFQVKRYGPIRKEQYSINKLRNYENIIAMGLSDEMLKDIKFIYCKNNDRCFSNNSNIAKIDNKKCLMLDKDRCYFGRLESCDVNVIENDSSISRIHFKIEIKNNTAILKDCQSTNGTYLNGKLIQNEAILKPGDIIEVGETQLVYGIKKQTPIIESTTKTTDEE